MKKMLLALVALMSVSLTVMAEPKIKFDKTTHNFGNI